MSPRFSIGWSGLPAAALLAGSIWLIGCQSDPPIRRPPSVRAGGFDLAVPPVLQGTVGSQAVFAGLRPTLVRGYGLVVALNGTGSRDVQPQLRARMLAEMARKGVGSEQSGYPNLSPQMLLDSEDTAVVIVEAIIPAGAVNGTPFNVRVVADPTTGTTSLEGGILYTTEMRPSVGGRILPSADGREAAALAVASGPIIINPFVEPGTAEERIGATIGRILDGGEVTKSIPIKLQLARPSHAQAGIIERAINTRFPREFGQEQDTAHGVSDETIEVTVPPSYHDRAEEFLELVRHTTIRLSAPERVAQSLRQLVMENPAYANAASWRWQALGQKAIPVFRELYDTPNPMVRLAALRAGARLDHPPVIPHLIEMSSDDGLDFRRRAIQLLGNMRPTPIIDQALRVHLNDESIEIRLAAYEALAQRQDPFMRRYDVDGKFELHVVQADEPMIYITQVSEPRIVIFGEDQVVKAPFVLFEAWSSRLMIQPGLSSDVLDVRYLPLWSTTALREEVPAALPGFIISLAHDPTLDAPGPGMGMTYSETVGALYQLYREKLIETDFKAEQDRILAAINEYEREEIGQDRPEFSAPEDGEAQPRPQFIEGGSDLGRLGAPGEPG